MSIALTNQDSSGTNVLKFDTTAKAKAEHQKLLDALGALDWSLQLAAVVKSLGMPMTEILVDRYAKVPGASLAGRLGHDDVGGYITSSEAEGGLSLAWSDWEKMVTAARMKSLYGVYLETPDEIMTEYGDVCKILGHVPADSGEYNKAKDDHLVRQRNLMAEKYRSEIDEISLKLFEAQSNEKSVRMDLVTAYNKMRDIEQEHSLKIREIEEKTQLAKEMAEKDRIEELKSQRNEIEEKYISAMHQMKAEYEQIIAINEAEKESLKKSFSAENYVPMAEHLAVKDQLNQERENNTNLLVRLNDATLKLEKITSSGDGSSSEILNLKRVISEQTLRINVLTSQISSGSTNINKDEFENMSEKIKELTGYVNKFRESRIYYKVKSESLAARIEKLNQTVKKYEHIIQEQKKPATTGFFKKALSVLKA